MTSTIDETAANPVGTARPEVRAQRGARAVPLALDRDAPDPGPCGGGIDHGIKPAAIAVPPRSRVLDQFLRQSARQRRHDPTTFRTTQRTRW